MGSMVIPCSNGFDGHTMNPYWHSTKLVLGFVSGQQNKSNIFGPRGPWATNAVKKLGCAGVGAGTMRWIGSAEWLASQGHN